MNRRVLRIAAWLALAVIIFATLSPIGLRPQTHLPVNMERGAAYFLAGALFGLAYPRHILWAAVLLAIGAVGLELAQMLQPSRHGRGLDALFKLGGAWLGLALGWLSARLIKAG
jgi:VanZ family protein